MLLCTMSPALRAESDVPEVVSPPVLETPPDPDQERRCLTAAIYYEGAREPVAGQEAVARVILNRTRHRDYPATVCGVVWQGHERRTGCQFSFTCDGSLSRRPLPVLWRSAAIVAEHMLAARPSETMSPLAQALNYHASYVVPPWRRELVEVARIGRHIFYERPGAAWATRQGNDAPPAAKPASLSVWGLDLGRIATSGGAGR